MQCQCSLYVVSVQSISPPTTYNPTTYPLKCSVTKKFNADASKTFHFAHNLRIFMFFSHIFVKILWNIKSFY